MDLRSQTPLGHRASTERRIAVPKLSLEEQSFLNRPITHAPPPLNLLKSPRIFNSLVREMGGGNHRYWIRQYAARFRESNLAALASSS